MTKSPFLCHAETFNVDGDSKLLRIARELFKKQFHAVKNISNSVMMTQEIQKRAKSYAVVSILGHSFRYKKAHGNQERLFGNALNKKQLIMMLSSLLKN